MKPIKNATPPQPIRASSLKLPERRGFASPMPNAKSPAEGIPTILTVVAGCAALTSITFSILIYLKH